jgi:hypothetical protein
MTRTSEARSLGVHFCGSCIISLSLRHHDVDVIRTQRSLDMDEGRERKVAVLCVLLLIDDSIEEQAVRS